MATARTPERKDLDSFPLFGRLLWARAARKITILEIFHAGL